MKETYGLSVGFDEHSVILLACISVVFILCKVERYEDGISGEL